MHVLHISSCFFEQGTTGNMMRTAGVCEVEARELATGISNAAFVSSKNMEFGQC